VLSCFEEVFNDIEDIEVTGELIRLIRFDARGVQKWLPFAPVVGRKYHYLWLKHGYPGAIVRPKNLNIIESYEYYASD